MIEQGVPRLAWEASLEILGAYGGPAGRLHECVGSTQPTRWIIGPNGGSLDHDGATRRRLDRQR